MSCKNNSYSRSPSSLSHITRDWNLKKNHVKTHKHDSDLHWWSGNGEHDLGILKCKCGNVHFPLHCNGRAHCSGMTLTAGDFYWLFQHYFNIISSVVPMQFCRVMIVVTKTSHLVTVRSGKCLQIIGRRINSSDLGDGGWTDAHYVTAIFIHHTCIWCTQGSNIARLHVCFFGKSRWIMLLSLEIPGIACLKAFDVSAKTVVLCLDWICCVPSSNLSLCL